MNKLYKVSSMGDRLIVHIPKKAVKLYEYKAGDTVYVEKVVFKPGRKK